MENVREMYKSDAELIAIQQIIKYGEADKFYNHYGYDRKRGCGVCIAGKFDTLEEARAALRKHRPTAEKLNKMCIGCLCLMDECSGECNQGYSGCIYKKGIVRSCRFYVPRPIENNFAVG